MAANSAAMAPDVRGWTINGKAWQWRQAEEPGRS